MRTKLHERNNAELLLEKELAKQRWLAPWWPAKLSKPAAELTTQLASRNRLIKVALRC